jgi:hypothetical protein
MPSPVVASNMEVFNHRTEDLGNVGGVEHSGDLGNLGGGSRFTQ